MNEKDINQSGTGSVGVNFGIVNNTIQNQPIPKVIVPLGITASDVIGREEALQEVLELVDTCDKPVHIRGMRGLGKTTLGKLVYQTIVEKDSFSYYAAVELTGNFLNSFLKNLRVKCNVDLNPNEDDEARFEKIVTVLFNLVNDSAIKKKGFLFLDNALLPNSIDKDKQDYLRKVVDRLSNWKIFITSYQSIPYVEEYPLDYLSIEKAVELFQKYCPNKGSATDVQKLIELLMKHTLTIELMAKTLESSRIKTVSELYEILSKHDFEHKALSQKKVDSEHSREYIIAFEYICQIFDLSELEKEESSLYVLKNFYFLPDFMDKEEFSSMTKTESWDEYSIDAEIENLYKKGWLEKGNEETYRLHSIIKEVVRKKATPTFADSRQLVVSVIEKINDSSIPMQTYYNWAEIAKGISDSIEEINEEMAELEICLGNLYQTNGFYDEAIQYIEKSKEKFFQLHGERNPDVATTYNIIGGAYRHKGEYDKAIEYYEKAIDIKLEKLGERHTDVAKIYNDIGLAYRSKGEYDKAIEYYEKAIDILITKLGEREQNVALIYNNFGTAYRHKGEYDKAIEWYEKAIDILIEKLGERHPDVATTYNNIGKVYESESEYDKAIEYYEKAIDILLEKLGERHPIVATIYNNLGGANYGKGEYERTIEYCEKAIGIQFERLGKRHPDVATTYNIIGKVYYSKSEYDQAIICFEKALDIQLEKIGERHPDISTTFNNIGLVYEEKGKYDNAIEYYKKAIDIQLDKLGERHPALPKSYSNMGLALLKKGEISKSVNYFKKALNILHSLYRENHQSISDIKYSYDASRIIVAVQEMQTNQEPFKELVKELGKERVFGILKDMGFKIGD